MGSMRAAVLLAPGKIEVQEIPIPSVRPDEILVNVKACGICTYERRLYSGEKSGRYPLVAGHEASGVVVEVGNAVRRRIEPGARVVLDLLNRCGECKYCLTGRGNLCENKFKGDLNVMGGFGEYVSVPSEQVFPIADSISFEEATLTEPVSCCLHALRNVGAQFGEDMVVFGAGTMGMIQVILGTAMGLRVAVVEPTQERRRLAMKLGACLALDPSSGDIKGQITDSFGGHPDIVVVTAAVPEVVLSAVGVADKGTRLTLYTSFPKEASIPLDLNRVHYSEIELTGAESRTATDFYTACKVISSGVINVRPLVSRVVPLAEIDKALAAPTEPEVMRVVVSV